MGCADGSQYKSFQGCVLGQLGGVSGIHMNGDYFGLGEGIGLKLGRMIGSIWGYPLCLKTLCVYLSGCLYMRYE